MRINWLRMPHIKGHLQALIAFSFRQRSDAIAFVNRITKNNDNDDDNEDDDINKNNITNNNKQKRRPRHRFISL